MRLSAGRGSNVVEERKGKMKAAQRERREGVSGLRGSSADCLECRRVIMWSAALLLLTW